MIQLNGPTECNNCGCNLWPCCQKNKKKDEGGGEYRILENGKIFDNAGVNFSEVSGKFHKKFRSQILGAKKNPNYWASGISIVAHMKNPNIPAIHFNTRFVITSKKWFGGGMDLTQSIFDKNENNKNSIF